MGWVSGGRALLRPYYTIPSFPVHLSAPAPVLYNLYPMRRVFAFFFLIIGVGSLLGCGSRSSGDGNAILVKPGQSLQAVIDSAPAHSTIIISRGTWTENLRLEKSITLRGQGPEATIIQAARAGPPVLWVGKNAQVTVEGLTLKGGRGGYVGPEMSSAGVFVAEEAVLHLRQARIIQNAASGVFARDLADLRLEKVEISENTRYGVELIGEAQAQLKETQVFQNGMGGIWISQEAFLEAEGLVIKANPHLGLWARDAAKVKLWNSEVRENSDPGLRCQDKSEVTLLASQILGNDGVGVEVLSDALLSAYGTVFQNNWDGLQVRGGTVELQGCFIWQNRWDGINARGNAFVKLERTEISGGQGAGVATSERAAVKLVHCVIKDFLAAGVSGFSAVPVTGEANKIEGNGVPLLGNVQSELREKKAIPVWEFLSFPHPNFPDLQSAIDALLPGGVLEVQPGSYTAGVTVDKPLEIRAKGDVVFKGIGSTAPVFSLVAGASLKLEGGKITGGSEGLAMGARSAAELSDCVILENLAGIKLWQDARLTATRVSVSKHSQGGIWLWDESQATLKEMDIRENEMCGIGVGGRSFLQLSQSSIIGNGWLGGVLLRESARVELWDNTFSGNKGYGLAVESSACVGSGPGFWGKVVGGRNTFLGNYKGAVCPAEFIFLAR